jgi:hypothetical protein
MGMNEQGWRENIIYPGTHWLYHDQRGNYKARVDYGKWTNYLYMWRVMANPFDKDIVGYEKTLEEAQAIAEKIAKGQICQLKLILV